MRAGFKASVFLLSGVILAACGGGDKEQPQIGPISGHTGVVLNASFDPQVAVDNSGNAIAVWTLFNGVRRNVWANRYVAGSGWGRPQLIESDHGADSGLPQIVVRKSTGDAIVVWEKSDNTRRNIWANQYDAAGQRWGTAQLLETDDAGFANAPHVAMDGSGNAMAVWEQSDGTRKNIWSNRYDASAHQWSVPVLIEGDGSDARSPQIAVDGNGSFVAVWGQMAASNAVDQYDSVQKKRYNLWVNRYDVAAQQWGGASLISDNSIVSGDPSRNAVVSGNADDPHVAMDANGNALAVWVQSNHVYASRYVVGSGWQAQTPVENDANWAVAVPRIAMTNNGDALVVWEQYFDNDLHDKIPAWKNIWANRYVAGVGWQVAQLIEHDDTGHALTPQVAFDGAGNALAVWRQWDGAHYSIWSNRFDAAAGAGWGAAGLIEASDMGNAFSPQIAVDGTGNALTVWSQSYGVRTLIDANRYTVGVGWGSAGSIEGR